MRKTVIKSAFIILTAANFACASFEEGIKKLDAGELAKAEAIADKLEAPAKFQLKALCEFFSGDYPGALKTLENIAPSGAPSSNLYGEPESLRFYLKKLTEITTGFSEFESEHFRLRLEGTDKVLKDDALETLETIRIKIGEAFGYMPEDKVLAEIYPDKEGFAYASTLGNETLERSGAIGICKFNRIMIVSPGVLPQGYRWLDSLCHEYVHFIVNRVSAGGCPLWLHEGTARYYDTLWRSDPPVYATPGNENLLVQALKEDRLISFRRMSPSLVYLKNQDEVNLAFIEVASAVGYMKKSHPGSLRRLISGFSFEKEPFRAALGLSQDEFEKEWLERLKKSSPEIVPGAAPDRIYWKKYDEVDAFVGVSARDYVRLGDRFRMSLSPEKGSYDLALAEYEKALKIEPYNPVALAKASRMYFALGISSRAVSVLSLCIEKNPNYVTPYELLGEWYLSTGDYTRAVSLLAEALAINPYNPLTHINLARSYMAAGRQEDARGEFSNALILDPGNPYLIRMTGGNR